ncbi:ArsR/SmtB family transcription factor [Leucobacter albus]|uniref:ArsR/SmtB family transcription factor n=1 Tax=Leucobacter albus TaxID=272210 RepID=A0ABW3TJ77_9MICO
MTEQPNLHSAAHMRVLAHPTRLKLLALLREHGPQTAAHLARYVDEAPGSLSYHLRKLAGASFIEEAPELGTDARQRWWRATHATTAWDTTAFARDPEKLTAQKDMYRALGQAYAQRLSDYIDSTAELPDEWLEAGFTSDRSLRLTPGQLREMGAELEALQQRWLAASAANRASATSDTGTASDTGTGTASDTNGISDTSIEAAEVFFLVQGYKQP